MKIALLEAPHRFRIEEQPIPEFDPDEVLVRVAACGVCTSDIHPWEEGGSNLPLALGHEVSGVIEQVGSDANTFKPGDRVAVWATGKGYAEYVAVNAVEMADVSLGDDVVIIGAGFMGNLVQKLVALRGPRQVIVADTRVDA